MVIRWFMPPPFGPDVSGFSGALARAQGAVFPFGRPHTLVVETCLRTLTATKSTQNGPREVGRIEADRVGGQYRLHRPSYPPLGSEILVARLCDARSSQANHFFLWFRFGLRVLVRICFIKREMGGKKKIWREEGGNANSEMGNTCTRYVGLGEPGRVYVIQRDGCIADISSPIANSRIPLLWSGVYTYYPAMASDRWSLLDSAGLKYKIFLLSMADDRETRICLPPPHPLFLY